MAVLASLATATRDGSTIGEALRAIANPRGTIIGSDTLVEGAQLAAAGDPLRYVGASSPITLDQNGDMAVVQYERLRYGDNGVSVVDRFERQSSRRIRAYQTHQRLRY